MKRLAIMVLFLLVVVTGISAFAEGRGKEVVICWETNDPVEQVSKFSLYNTNNLDKYFPEGMPIWLGEGEGVCETLAVENAGSFMSALVGSRPEPKGKPEWTD